MKVLFSKGGYVVLHPHEVAALIAVRSGYRDALRALPGASEFRPIFERALDYVNEALTDAGGERVAQQPRESRSRRRRRLPH
jgi:hypothetical protein